MTTGGHIAWKLLERYPNLFSKVMYSLTTRLPTQNVLFTLRQLESMEI